MKTISMSARVHDDAPLPAYSIGDRVYDAGVDGEGMVMGVIYSRDPDYKPEWAYYLRFPAGETRISLESDLSYPDEPDV